MVGRLQARLGARHGTVFSLSRAAVSPVVRACLGLPPWRQAALLGSNPPASYCFPFVTL